MNTKILKNQKGFTLIEIIAVLVILGILAAVAVPKFMSLTEDAKKKAVDGALGAGLSRVSMLYAKLSLSDDEEPSVTKLAGRCGSISGDFSYSFTANVGTSAVEVLVWKKGDKSFYTTAKDWAKP